MRLVTSSGACGATISSLYATCIVSWKDLHAEDERDRHFGRPPM